MQTQQDPGRLLRSFLDVALQVTEGIEEEKVLVAIVDRAMELTGSTGGGAITLDGEQEPLHVVERGADPDGGGFDERKLIEVLSKEKTVRLDEAGELGGRPSDRFLGLCLEHRGAGVGYLFVTKPSTEPGYTEDEQDVAEAIGALAGVAIDNARLFAAESARAQRAALLRHVASKVRRSLDLNDVLNATVETLGTAAQVDRCFIRLQSIEEPGQFEMAAEWHNGSAKPLGSGTGREFPVADLAARMRSTQWTEDATHDTRLDPGGEERAVLATPLEWGEELLGVVAFHTLEPRAWTASDRALIEAAAREVSIALNHARLYEEAVATAARLRELDEMRSDFISMVSHELRSPMTVVAGIADILNKRRHKLSDERQTELISTLGREARRLTRLVSEVLDLEAIDQGRMDLHRAPLDVSALCSEAIADAGESTRTKLVVEPGNTNVTGDYDKIKQVILNLISNAAKFSGENSPITVTVTPRDDGVLVSVADVGPGIPDEYKPRLFQRFSRVKATGARKPGSGLGLYLARIIIEGHGGEIWCDSTVGEGATFTFRLPR